MTIEQHFQPLSPGPVSDHLKLPAYRHDSHYRGPSLQCDDPQLADGTRTGPRVQHPWQPGARVTCLAHPPTATIRPHCCAVVASSLGPGLQVPEQPARPVPLGGGGGGGGGPLRSHYPCIHPGSEQHGVRRSVHGLGIAKRLRHGLRMPIIRQWRSLMSIRPSIL